MLSLQSNAVNTLSAPKRFGEPANTSQAGVREEIFNHSELLKRLGNKEWLIADFISMFIEEVDQGLPALEKAIMSEDIKSVSSYVHSIKGVAGNIAAGRIYSISIELDAHAKSGDVISLKAGIASLRTEYELFKAEIDAFLSVNPGLAT